MIQRAMLIAGIGGLVLGGALLGVIALQGWRGGPTAGAGIEPAPPALQPATPLPITPTAPVTPSLHPEWYPTSPSYHVSPSVLPRHIAFVPDSLDVAFTINRAAEGDARDVFVVPADPDGVPSGTAVPLFGLPDGAGALELKASDEAGLIAVAAFDEAGPEEGGRFASLWLVSADGRSVERFAGGGAGIDDFWWLPDGSALAILYPDGRLALRNRSDGVETGMASGLIGPAGQASVLLSWSPDGRYAALGTVDRDDGGASLELLDSATGARTLLADFGVRGAPLPLFGADGTTIHVFVADGAGPGSAALYAADPRAPGAIRLLADLSTVGDAPAWVPSAVAGPTGQDLYFLQDGAIHRIGTDGSGLEVVVPKGAEVVRGELVLQVVEGGRSRLGYLVSEYRGASAIGADVVQGVTTAFAVRTIDVSAP